MNLDLEPGDYRDQKPKGWRWRLPWAHPEDSKLHFTMCFACLVVLGYFFVNRMGLSPDQAMSAGALFGSIAAANLILALRD